ncbi:MAG: hypothetical protein K8L99_01800 [Anaerolineae bacterium]|nr:hypothetical protein [Anaerolineae bacterium]
MAAGVYEEVRNFNIMLLQGKKRIFETVESRLNQEHEMLRHKGWTLHQHWHFSTLKGRVSLYVFSSCKDNRGLDSVDSARQLACRLVGAPDLPSYEMPT